MPRKPATYRTIIDAKKGIKDGKEHVFKRLLVPGRAGYEQAAHQVKRTRPIASNPERLLSDANDSRKEMQRRKEIYLREKTTENKEQYREALYHTAGLNRLIRRDMTLDKKFPIFNDNVFNEHVFRFLRNRTIHQPISYATVDLDLFKKVNDQFGHQVGDHVLYAMSKLLTEKATALHGVAGRFGGEELRIAAPVSALKLKRALEEVQQELKMALTDPQSVGVTHATLTKKWKAPTFSAGVTSLTDSKIDSNLHFGQKMEKLAHDSDAAVYHAKAAGRNRVVIFGERKTTQTRVKEMISRVASTLRLKRR